MRSYLKIKMIANYSADSHYEVTLMTKATVYFNGAIVWQPPAIYKSSCAIDVEYFPYDVQTCFLKMGSWTYSGFQVSNAYTTELEKIDNLSSITEICNCSIL